MLEDDFSVSRTLDVIEHDQNVRTERAGVGQGSYSQIAWTRRRAGHPGFPGGQSFKAMKGGPLSCHVALPGRRTYLRLENATR